MTSATTTASTAIPSKFMTRSRWFGVVYLIFGVLLVYLAMTALDPEAVSKFRFGQIEASIMDRLPEAVQTGLKQGVPIPSRNSMLLVGILLLITGVVPFLLPPQVAKRYENLVLMLVFGLLLAAVLIYAATGKRTDVVSMLADGIRLATPIALGALAGILWTAGSVLANPSPPSPPSPPLRRRRP